MERRETRTAPAPPAFDLGETAPPRPTPAFDLREAHHPPARLRTRIETLRARGGWVGATGALLLFLLKFQGVFAFLKFAVLGKHFLTLGSAFLFAWTRAQQSGWPMAIGMVLMIFTHECGHALAARRYRLPYAGMLFIPFLGGIVFHRRGNTTIVQDAFIGIMGPVVGTLFGIACALAYALSQAPFWLVLAQWTFLVNAANLICPFPPFDGHWIAAVFSRHSGARREERWRYGLGWAGLAVLLIWWTIAAHRALAERMPVGLG